MADIIKSPAPVDNTTRISRESAESKLIKAPAKFLFGPTVAITGGIIAGLGFIFSKLAELTTAHFRKLSGKGFEVRKSLLLTAMTGAFEKMFKKSMGTFLSPYKNTLRLARHALVSYDPSLRKISDKEWDSIEQEAIDFPPNKEEQEKVDAMMDDMVEHMETHEADRVAELRELLEELSKSPAPAPTSPAAAPPTRGSVPVVSY